MHVKKGDNVLVRSGNEAGKSGVILDVNTKKHMVIVEKVNMGKKHVKPHRPGDAGGIVDFERPISASNVMLICPKCKEASRTKMVFDKDGTKSRSCKKCGAKIDKVGTK